MISHLGFRATLIGLAAVIGGLGIGSMITDVSAARMLLNWPTAPSSGACLRADRALADALETLRHGTSRPARREDGDRARAALRQALSLAPHDAQLWLALAALEVGRDPDGPAGVEPLKMAYFTAPNDARLMATRLEVATRMTDPVDMELRLLVEGDLRLMLTRQPDQGAAVLSAYGRASNRGEALIENAVKDIAPSFLRTLHG